MLPQAGKFFHGCSLCGHEKTNIDPLCNQQGEIMTLVLRCKDVGFDCDGIVRAESEEELLEQVVEHANTVHGVEEVSKEMVEKVKSAIQTE